VLKVTLQVATAGAESAVYDCLVIVWFQLGIISVSLAAVVIMPV